MNGATPDGVSVQPSLGGHWAALVDASRDALGRVDQDRFVGRLTDWIADDYRSNVPSSLLVEFSHGPAVYLFDTSNGPQAERTVLAVAHPEPPASARDVTYQRGFPLRDRLAGRSVDRGHFVPYTAGGLFGPNLFVQDRALNRGWSQDGREYRKLERAAVDGAPKSLFLVHPSYADDSDIPEFIDLGVVVGADFTMRRFRNRFDTIPMDARDLLPALLGGATDAQVGALGEETAAVLLEDDFDATIVAMGDAGMPRDEGRQDLDLLAIVEDTLIVYEIKTRYLSRAAGRCTRAGNLPRPRLRKPRTSTGARQGSQEYVAARLNAFIDTEDGYEGVDVRVMAIDLKAMLAQQFAVNDNGTRLTPLSPPLDCTDASRKAVTRILDHRGYL